MNVAPHVWDTAHTWGEVTRPCRFSLRLQRGAVFADFGVDDRGLARLLRISFDGYGCCRVEGGTGPMPPGDIALLLRFADGGDADAVCEALRRYFEANLDVLWEDALTDHGLLGGVAGS